MYIYILKQEKSYYEVCKGINYEFIMKKKPLDIFYCNKHDIIEKEIKNKIKGFLVKDKSYYSIGFEQLQDIITDVVLKFRDSNEYKIYSKLYLIPNINGSEYKEMNKDFFALSNKKEAIKDLEVLKDQVKDIENYLKSLKPPPSIKLQFLQLLTVEYMDSLKYPSLESLSTY